MHQLLLQGPDIPGWVCDRVLAVLSLTQAPALTMSCEPHPESVTLNWHPLDGQGEGIAMTSGRRHGLMSMRPVMRGVWVRRRPGGGAGGCRVSVVEWCGRCGVVTGSGW